VTVRSESLAYLQASSNLIASGKVGNQYARNTQSSNFARANMPIPPNRMAMDASVLKLIGRLYTFPRRFHSSLAFRLSVGVNGEPNK